MTRDNDERDNDERERVCCSCSLTALHIPSQLSINNNLLHIASQLPIFRATSSTTHYTSQASCPAIKLHHQQPITHRKPALHLSSYIINNLLHISSKLSSYQATTSTTHYTSHAGSIHQATTSTTTYYTSQARSPAIKLLHQQLITHPTQAPHQQQSITHLKLPKLQLFLSAISRTSTIATYPPR